MSAQSPEPPPPPPGSSEPPRPGFPAPAPRPPGPPPGPPVQSGPPAQSGPVRGPSAYGSARPPDAGYAAPPPVSPVSPASGDGPRRRGRGTLLAIAVSLLALTVAVAAVLVAWRALDQANDARDIAKAAGAGQGAPAVGQGTAQPTTEATPAQPPATDQPPTEQPVDPGATPEEPVLNEQTRYEQAYTKEALTLRPNSCRTTTVDLDEPRVRVDDNQAETEFNAECGTVPAYFSFPANVRVTQVDGVANLTPVDCGKRVRTGALNPDTRVPAKMGTMFCLVTSLASAVQSGIRQKMVVLRVAGISQDGTVSVEASAWHIPR